MAICHRKNLKKNVRFYAARKGLFCLCCDSLFLLGRFFRRLARDINDYHATIFAAGIAHMVPKVQCRAILALRKARLRERVVRAAVAAMGAGMAHSDYHKGKYSRKGLKSKGAPPRAGRLVLVPSVGRALTSRRKRLYWIFI